MTRLESPIIAYIQENTLLIEQELTQSFPSEWMIPEGLKDAMMYSLMAGGKRLRPILALAAAEAVGGQVNSAVPAACAIELIHTYSLIHDDLPAMDNDDFRRGKPTNHRVFGEAMAILAGDGLLTHAFHLLAETASRYDVPADRVLSMIKELSIYAGPRGMVGGQVADILGEQGITNLAELEFIHLHKTSDLIVCALRAGAHTARADEQQLAALELFGYRIGLAFQIQDDILDLTGDESKLGKSTQSDVKANKVTYPYFLGLEACQSKVKILTREAQEAIEQARLPHPERLLQLADYLMDRDH
ncbi:MAG: polyprenyl synthetase family protein [Paenibacillaceae bacterium]